MRVSFLSSRTLWNTQAGTHQRKPCGAGRLLPDLLRYDPARPASFPDNGRALIDDVSDLFLAILTNGKVTGDNVGPHDDFLDEFPYLGPPHVARRQ
jgi:Domain of unknown function (DUF4331)